MFCVVGNLNTNNQNNATNSVIALSLDSADNYYAVSTAAEFLSLCNDSSYWDKNIKMTNDIEITEFSTFKSIGGETPFSGTFNGQGHTLTLTGIEDVPAQGGPVDLSGYKGHYYGVWGNLTGSIKNIGINYNCTSSNGAAYDDMGGEKAYICAGGVVAYLNNGEIKNCVLSGYLLMSLGDSGTDWNVATYVGGFVGKANVGNITNCVINAELNISAKGGFDEQCGTFVGYNYGNEPNCSNNIINSKAISILGRDKIDKSDPYHIGYNSLAIWSTLTSKRNTNDGTYHLSTVPSELQNNKDAFINGTSNYTWNASYPWDFDNVWTFVDGENDGLPVLKVFYPSQTTELTLTGTVSCPNSLMLLTIVNASGDVIQEIGFVTTQENVNAVITLKKNEEYKILVTKPFGSVLTVTGTTQSSSTVYTLSTGTNDVLSVTFSLSGSGQWSNTVVV